MSLYSRDTTTAAPAHNLAGEYRVTNTPSSEIAARNGPPHALSNQLTLDDYNATAVPILNPNEYNQHIVDPLVFGPSTIWEYTSTPPLFGEGMPNGTAITQNCRLNEVGNHARTVGSCLPSPHQGSWDTNWWPLFPYIDQAMMPAGFPTEGVYAPTAEDSIPAPELGTTHYTPSNTSGRTISQPATSRAVPPKPRVPHDPPAAEEKTYDRPGKKPAAIFQNDPLKLEDSFRQAGGSAFAVGWIVQTFKYGVTTEALLRDLNRKETAGMNFPGGFEPHQAYDGFISKVGERYECGLCKEGKRTRWKHKKDAPRHLRKFHFGLADVCKDCGKDVFNKAEMKTHRCARRAKAGAQMCKGYPSVPEY